MIIRKTIVRTLAVLYGLQVLLVVPWILGSMYRGEIPPSPWKEFAKSLARHGAADACLCLYLYAVFYSSLFAISFAFLKLWIVIVPAVTTDYLSNISQRRSVKLIAAALWLPITFALYSEPILGFARHVFQEGALNEWLALLWIALTLGTLILVQNVTSLASGKGESQA